MSAMVGRCEGRCHGTRVAAERVGVLRVASGKGRTMGSWTGSTAAPTAARGTTCEAVVAGCRGHFSMAAELKAQVRDQRAVGVASRLHWETDDAEMALGVVDLGPLKLHRQLLLPQISLIFVLQFELVAADGNGSLDDGRTVSVVGCPIFVFPVLIRVSDG